MPNKKKDRKYLVDFVFSHEKEIENMSDFDSFFSDIELKDISIKKWIEQYKSNNDIITIDARSESEYEKSHLPGAINFPILNDKERDEVGFLYKQFSPKSAFYLAERVANKKLDKLYEFVEKIRDRKLYIYCARGGQRSSALYYYVTKSGCDAEKITGGYKAFRKEITDLLYDNPKKIKILTLGGLTGCGKTEILEEMRRRNYPVFDIEKSAAHASSLLGKVRFEEEVHTQSEFESNLYKELLIKNKFELLPYFSETESKKISNFKIPNSLYQHLLISPTINIIDTIERRRDRIVKEYFGGNGKDHLLEIVTNSQFLLKKLGRKQIDNLKEMLNSGNYGEFTEWFMVNYYDKRYATNYKNIIGEVNNIDLDMSIEEIVKLTERFFKI